MIQVILKDEGARSLETAKLTISWEGETDDDGKQIEYGLDNVKALMLLDPLLGTMPGTFKGMPVMGIRFTDEPNDLAIEVPIPLDFAESFGDQIAGEVRRYVERIRAEGKLPTKGIQTFASIPEDMKGKKPGNGAA